ncbi:hypothetical protein C1A50_2321 [Paenibacillus polymyxa]|nr:hypothetical protein C1A50_2321 [Paenibacillus polymyxa]
MASVQGAIIMEKSNSNAEELEHAAFHCPSASNYIADP